MIGADVYDSKTMNISFLNMNSYQQLLSRLPIISLIDSDYLKR